MAIVSDPRPPVPEENTADSPSSAVDQLKWIFDLCDQDHDGLITVEEFRSLGQHYLGAVSQRIDQLIHELDPTKSGVITFDSFSRGIEAYLIGKRDSVTSSRSDSLSRASFEENYLISSNSPVEDNAFPAVGDVLTRSDLETSQLSYYSLGFTDTSSPVDIRREPNAVEVMVNGTSDTDSFIDESDQAEKRHSIQGIEIQPADNSPTLVARALLRRSNHSLLHVSGAGSSYSSTPEWRLDEDNDELTDKLQELSSRLEGLEIDLDTSQSEKAKLKKENAVLRERLEMFEDTLRDVQHKNEEAIGMVRSTSSATVDKIKKQYSSKFQELEYQLIEEQEKQQSIESHAEMLKRQLTERDLEFEEKAKHTLSLTSKISELEGELLRTREQLRLVKSELESDKLDHQQEIEAMNHVIVHLRSEIEETKFTKKRNAINLTDHKMAEVATLRKEVKSLTEENKRLKCQFLQQGQQLLGTGPAPSLADELQDAPRADVMKALKEQEEMTARLQQYIEGLLVNILDSHPELLEVK